MHSPMYHHQLRSPRRILSDNESSRRILRQREWRWEVHQLSQRMGEISHPLKWWCRSLHHRWAMATYWLSFKLHHSYRLLEDIAFPSQGAIREDRVQDNPMGHEHLWSPITNPHWEPCHKKKILQYGMAASHIECSLCPGAKAHELLPCCWCTNWVHTKCSYAVPEGRACAAHFDVVNPLEKQVIASMGDDTIPEHFKGKPGVSKYRRAQSEWAIRGPEACHVRHRGNLVV